jgi:hypothetical protein
MVEKVALPANTRSRCRIPFPSFDHACHPDLRHKINKQMDVVRHEKQQMDVPVITIFIEPGGFEQSG